MAVTVAFSTATAGRQRVGRQHVVDGRLTLSGTYATGGFAVTAADFGLSSIESLRVNTPFEGTAAYAARWDSTNSKVFLYVGDNDNVADAPLIEVANTTDVSDVALDITVKGR
jgi:hypothetical protein